MSADVPSFGIYVHWPFCAAVCPYCDFNVRRDRGGDHGDLLDAIIADLYAQAARVARRGAGSLYLGGGTPSLLSGRQVETLIAAADASFGLATGAEISIECNPEHHVQYAEHVAAGANRLSLGVQALDAPSLLMLGRRHSVREAEAAIAAAAQTGARVSVDLIYARAGQSVEDWAGELSRMLAAPVEHLSLYQLTIEAGTPFARAVARGRMAAAGVDAAADLYAATQEIMNAAGFPAYEISNHARSRAAQARHNLVYWRSGDWVGVGPGAHGRVTLEGRRTATEAERAPDAYVRAVRERGVGWARADALRDAESADEMLLMGLRLSEGLDRRRWERLRGRAADARVLAMLAEANLLCADDARLRLTPAGRLVTDRVARELSA